MCKTLKSILTLNDLPCIILKHIFCILFDGCLPSTYFSCLGNVCKKWKVMMVKLTTSIELEMENYTTISASDIITSMLRIKDWFKNYEKYMVYGYSSVRNIKLRIHMTDRDFTPLCDMLSQCLMFTNLDLGLNDLGDGAAMEIAEKLISNKSCLEQLNLEGNKITDQGLSAIANAMKENSSITSLNLSKNYFGPDSHSDLANCLVDNHVLKKLIIKETFIAQSLDDYIKVLLSETSVLEYLDISGTNPGLHVKKLLQALCDSKHLKNIILDSNLIYPCYITFLTDVMIQESIGKENIHLEEISMNHNELGDFGVYELSKVFKYPYRMKSLSLAHNKITFCGLSHLCHSICKHAFIEKLDLSNNQLTDKAIPYLSYLFKNSKSLKEIHLKFCQLGGDASFKDVCHSLRENKSLTLLDLNCNIIDDNSAKSICEMLSVNTHLTHLYLSSNNITNLGSSHFASCFKDNNSLQVIDLAHNKIDYYGALVILESLNYNTSLKDINLNIANLPRNPILFKQFHKKSE